MNYFRRLVDAVRTNRHKSGEKAVGYLITKIYSTLFGFTKVFLSREHCYNTVASPILTSPGPRPFLPVPSNEISIAGTALL